MGKGFTVERTKLLSDANCRLIHEGSCRLLSEAGVHVESDRAVQMFLDGGASLENKRIKIPREMVEQAIQRTAKTIHLHARNSNHNVTIDVNAPEIYFGTGGQALNVLHYENGAFVKKQATTRDLIDIVRICEQLPNVDFITRPVEPDVPEEEMDLAKTRILLENTTKHMNLANLVRIDKLPDIIAAVQDPLLISFIASLTVSPLNLVSPTIDKFLKVIEHDIPVSISSCPQAGTTAPLSEIGELVQVNAEILSAVVLANLVRSGARVFYRGIPISSDLYSDGSPRWCQPESIRRIALITDLTYFYGIPCCGTAAVSDEKDPNPQTVAEKTFSWVFETASGAQFINSALGMLEQVLTVSPEQYIIDDSVIGMVKGLFNQTPNYNLRELAQTAVTKALEFFDVTMQSEMAHNISDRIDFILAEHEEYSSATVNTQIELIQEAVTSGRSSSKFMRASRPGLRSGWLYQGTRLEGSLDLTDVHRIKKDILAS